MLEIIQNISRTASFNAARPAVLSITGSLTYAELLNTTAILSNLFADRRIPRGSVIFFNISNPDLRLVAIVAALHYGVVPLLVPTREIVAGRIQPDYVVGAPEMLERELPLDLVLDETTLTGKLADTTLRDFEDRAPDEICLIGGSSGTTGQMKFVGETVSNRSQRIRDSAWYKPAERVMTTIGGGSRYFTVTALQIFSAGASLVRSYPDPHTNLNMMNVFSVNTLLATPATAYALIDSMKADHVKCPSVSKVQITGSLFSGELIRRLEETFDARIEVIYGTSETGRIASGVITSKDFVEGYVGEINPGVEVKYTAAGSDQMGRLAVLKKPGAGYWDAGQLVRDDKPFMELPDVGFVSDNRIFLSGRDDEVCNFSGNKIAFSKIEFEYRRQAEISDIGILSAPELGDPQDLMLAIVAPETLALDPVADSVCAALKLQFARPHFKVFRVDSLPRNALGKIDRKALKSLFLTGDQIAS